MQAKILKEVESKICLAKKYGLVPRDIMEIEFTIDQSGQGSTIEYIGPLSKESNVLKLTYP